MPAALLPKFKDPQPFAQGQTGVLHLAQQAQGGFKGLLKVIPLSGFEGSERVRLKRELRKQTKLAHDGLPRIVDGGELGSELWLFREFVTGESLAQRIRRLGRLEVDEALLITAQVASALDELQRNGLLHRDVKPGHVILGAGPKNMPISKLIDAGVAARLPGESVFDLIGTPAYISPEQVSGKLVSFRSDLYALGCMLFEMLTGNPPFAGDVKAVLEAHKSAKLPEPDVTLPASALALLRALLAKEPRQRPFSAQQVRRTLEPLLPAGAPLPVLQSRAPSSAGGISAPPPAGRGSSPGAGKPRSSVPPTPPAAARAGRDRSVPMTDTEEISLEEIELPPSQLPGPNTIQLEPDDIEELGRGPSTIALGDDDIAALEVREEAAALTAAVAREPEELAFDTGQVAALSAAAAAAQAEPAPAAEAPPAAAPEPAAAQQNAAAQAAEAAAASSTGSAPGRRAVDFDVESLFDDDVPHEPAMRPPTALHDAAPTQIYRPRSDAPPPGRAESAASERIEDKADPEGTVMVARPGARPKKRPPWLWIGVGAGLLLLLVLVFAGGDDDESQAAAENADTPPAAAEGESTAMAPTASAAQRGEPAAARAPSAQPKQPAQATPEAQGAAATDEAAPSQGVAPTPEQLEVAREEPAEQQPAAQAQPAQPAAAEPAAKGAAQQQALPAPAPVGEQRADEAGTLSAAAASAKLGPSAGSKLVAPRASRTDRLAKAAELKTQARAHYQAARYREAATAYRSATELDPSDAGAFAGLAASQLASGDANAAVASYSRAVRLQPGQSGFHAALGRAYLTSGDRNRARAAYQKALELNPNNGAAKTALEQLR